MVLPMNAFAGSTGRLSDLGSVRDEGALGRRGANLGVGMGADSEQGGSGWFGWLMVGLICWWVWGLRGCFLCAVCLVVSVAWGCRFRALVEVGAIMTLAMRFLDGKVRKGFRGMGRGYERDVGT